MRYYCNMKKNLKIAAALILAFVIVFITQKTIFNPQLKPDSVISFFTSFKLRPLDFSQTKPTINNHQPATGDLQTSGQMAFTFRVMPTPETLTPYFSQPTVVNRPVINNQLPIPTVSPSYLTPTPYSVTSSKLGAFILSGMSSGSQKILAVRPKIIKFMDPQYDGDQMKAARNYKLTNPNGIVVLRFYQGTTNIKYTVNNDPIHSAEEFFAAVIRPNLQMFRNDLKYFDYLQTPNEFENTPEWWGKEKTSWNGKFWLRLTQLNKSAGIKTCVGSMPVGNTTATDMSYIIDDLRSMKNMGAALCYHGYTFTYSTDVSQESQTSLRYRDWYNYFKNNELDLYSMPLILSESGVAENGQAGAGYLTNKRITDYENWLSWYDKQLQKDPYVIGATIFQIGDQGNWKSFNLEQISGWLASHISN